MTKFTFRLQKLLNYRRTLEDQAKTAYLEARARKIEAEFDITGIDNTRQEALKKSPHSLTERKSFDDYLSRLEAEKAATITLVGVLNDEEETARQNWITAKQEADALEKLREQAKTEWQEQADREEQAAIDEWATMRRAA